MTLLPLPLAFPLACPSNFCDIKRSLSIVSFSSKIGKEKEKKSHGKSRVARVWKIGFWETPFFGPRALPLSLLSPSTPRNGLTTRAPGDVFTGPGMIKWKLMSQRHCPRAADLPPEPRGINTLAVPSSLALCLPLAFPDYLLGAADTLPRPDKKPFVSIL